MGEALENAQTEFAGMVPGRDVVLTIGVFDGVHLGHRHLARQVMRRARELQGLSGIITFYPHPKAVLRPEATPPLLITLAERLCLLRGLGLDLVVALPFTPDLAHLSAAQFMALICRHIRLRELWVGPDFCLGCGREGTVARLTEMGRELAYQVCVVPPLVLGGQVVSSSLIRKLVLEGQIETAARLLQRRHHVSGTVLSEPPRDRQAQSLMQRMVVTEGLALPDEGVYGVYARSGTRQWTTTAFAEISSTGARRRLGVQLPDLGEDLGGRSLRVEFVRRLPSGMRSMPVDVYTSRPEGVTDQLNKEGGRHVWPDGSYAN